MTNFETLTIFGAGAFGTAMAHILMQTNNPPNVILWARNLETLNNAKSALCKNNTQNQPKNQRLHFTSNLDEACQSKAFIYALPAQTFRKFFQSTTLPPRSPLLITAKGIESQTGLFWDEILHQFAHPGPLFIWSGPHLAKEILANAHTIGLLGLPSMAHKKIFNLNTPFLKMNHTTDCKGMMVANAFKNTAALLNGLLAAEGVPENTRYTYLANFHAEMRTFGKSLGARASTFDHPALLGDFLLTTASRASRNTQKGEVLGRTNKPLDLASLNTPPIAEGLLSLNGLTKRAKQASIELPVLYALEKRIFQGGCFEEFMLPHSTHKT